MQVPKKIKKEIFYLACQTETFSRSLAGKKQTKNMLFNILYFFYFELA